MTQYVLKILSYAGIVPGARHYKGVVEGPSPSSCHGKMTSRSGGPWTCEEGHELPKRVKWDVEQDWTPERHERYRAATHRALEDDSRLPDGPGQFDSKQEVIDRAMVQFLDGLEGVNDPAEDGDELWYGYVHPEGFDYDPDEDYSDGWGSRIAVRCTT